MYSYAWRVRRPADLAQFSYECARCAIPDRPMGLYSMLERAHLSDDDEDIVLLCRTCHRRLDYPAWAADYKRYLERRRGELADELDAVRPILQFLRGFPS
jgi:hypothetical protein